MIRREKRLSLLSEAAYMYYELNLTQAQIAQRLYISRTSISRLLQEARDEGIVEIKIHYASERCYQLESIIKNKFNLEEAFVFNFGGSGRKTAEGFMFRNAARYVDSLLQPGMTFGISRGVIVAGVMRHLSENHPRSLDLNLVQLMGEVSDSGAAANSGDLIRKMLKTYGGQAHYLNAPLYVENEYVRKALLDEPLIRQVIKRGREADIVVTGIGVLDEDRSLLSSIYSSFMDDGTLHSLIANGGVGNMFGLVFDTGGRVVDHPFNQRIISIGFDNLRNMRVVAVSFGSKRGKAILGALQTGRIHALFTDRTSAEEVLALVDSVAP